MYQSILYPSEKGKSKSKAELANVRVLEHLGWFKRAVGVVILFFSISTLIWNEKRAVASSRSYSDGLRSLVVVPNPEDYRPQNEWKLVHVSGYLRISQPLEYPTYGVSIYAVKLKRRVQMFQWVEEKKSPLNDMELSPGSVRYSKEWKDKLADSSKFANPHNHDNPKSLPLSSETLINSAVNLGAFALGTELKERFNSFVSFTSGDRPESPDIKMHMGLYYHSADIWNPVVGDTRVQFSFAGPTNAYVSIVAMQSGGELRPFTTDSGAVIAFLHEGKKHHQDIFNKEHSGLAFESWAYRILSYLGSTLGTLMASKILSLLSRSSKVRGKGNKVVNNLMAMGPQKFSVVSSSFISCSLIGCIWFSHKPIFGFLLVTFSCALVLYYAFIGPDLNFNAKVNRASLPQYSRLY